ncbi:hypothetical protein [Mesorhizobium sp. B2-3-4]|uniref:hypothetical protein n=1 Tax=Mesorhizobium sp. B2-3-4 TaxID=2589959 RepID=UPI0015E41E79|nr:hypothetical protein [Mesorhizobium sp. B2-3-4]
MGNGWTFQTLIDGNMQLTAYCHACNHSKVLSLEKLKRRFGPDTPAMADDIKPKLKCEKCGSKKVGLIYAPDADKVSGMGRAIPPKSLYSKAKGE